jgi:hypothetical protein
MPASPLTEETFSRVMGCTAAELLGWLDRALPGARLAIDPAAARCVAEFDDGSLHMSWQALPAQRIALLAIPRLEVVFHYQGLAPERRRQVQRMFDLATQRGGG